MDESSGKDSRKKSECIKYSHARKKSEIGKELLMVDETREELEERDDKKK